MVGGGAASRLWRRVLADAFGLPLRFPAEAESAALGAALQARGLGGRVGCKGGWAVLRALGAALQAREGQGYSSSFIKRQCSAEDGGRAAGARRVKGSPQSLPGANVVLKKLGASQQARRSARDGCGILPLSQ